MNKEIIIAIQLELFELKFQCNDSLLDGTQLQSIMEQIKKIEKLLLKIEL